MQGTRFLTKAAALTLAALLLVLAPAACLGAEVSFGAELLWAKRFGSGYAGAPLPPLVSGDYVYVFAGKKLTKLNRLTGETVGESPEASNAAGYGIVPPSMGGGMVFVPLNRGSVAAFDEDTLELLWETEPLGGQCLTPVTYAEGRIFFGTWVTEERSGYYCGFSVDKNGCERLWTLEHEGGFYRAGALYEDGRLTFGSDDGVPEGRTAGSVLYSVDAATGELLSSVEGIEGDIRSDILSFDGGYVFSTKAGYIYKVKDGAVSRAYMGAACSSTPAVCHRFVYAGTADGSVTVVDMERMEVLRKISAPAYPNGGIAVRGNRLYAVCNALPGGVYTCGINDGSLTELYSPESGEMQEYSISPVALGDDGTLYYKNDSGHIFALSLYAGVSIDSPADEAAWLIRPEGSPVIEKIYLKKGENNLKIGGGGRVLLWREWLEPLTGVIYL